MTTPTIWIDYSVEFFNGLDWHRIFLTSDIETAIRYTETVKMPSKTWRIIKRTTEVIKQRHK
jgi:hypothetical protein